MARGSKPIKRALIGGRIKESRGASNPTDFLRHCGARRKGRTLWNNPPATERKKTIKPNEEGPPCRERGKRKGKENWTTEWVAQDRFNARARRKLTSGEEKWTNKTKGGGKEVGRGTWGVPSRREDLGMERRDKLSIREFQGKKFGSPAYRKGKRR